MCGKFQIPFGSARKTLFECIRLLPNDLGPVAVGLSDDFVVKQQTKESGDVRPVIYLLVYRNLFNN